MSDDNNTPEIQEAGNDQQEQQQGEPDAPLAEPGLKALAAEREARKAAEKAAQRANAEFQSKLAELQAKLDGKEKEYAEEQGRREVEAAALAKANERIVRSEIKAAAKGVLADPSDAFKFLDPATFDVDSDGSVDEEAVTKALADLVASKPYLAVAQTKRFQGSGDNGARKEPGAVSQLTRADMARMSPEQIVQAKSEGRFNDLLGIK